MKLQSTERLTKNYLFLLKKRKHLRKILINEPKHSRDYKDSKVVLSCVEDELKEIKIEWKRRFPLESIHKLRIKNGERRNE